MVSLAVAVGAGAMVWLSRRSTSGPDAGEVVEVAVDDAEVAIDLAAGAGGPELALEPR